MTNNLTAVIEGYQALQDPSIVDSDARNVRQIAYLLGAINACSEPESKAVLLSLLASEYAGCEQEEAEEQARRAAISEWPHDPLAFSALSAHLSRRDRHEDAIQVARQAIECADRTGNYKRHAWQTLARCLKRAEKYRELQDAIATLIELVPGQPDVPVERDFLVALPDGAVSRELVQAYLSKPARP